MNSYQIRALVAALVSALVFTALFILITPKSPIIIAGFVCCIFGIVEFFGSIMFVAGSTKKNYLVNTSFPFVTRGYAAAAILFSILICALSHFGVWTMNVGWFLFVQIIFAAVLVIMLLSLLSGKELIETTESNVAANYSSWKMLLADVEAILSRTSPESRADVAALRDAVQYADPMSRPEIQGIEQDIRNNVMALSGLVTARQQADISAMCGYIQNQILDRANRLKSLK